MDGSRPIWALTYWFECGGTVSHGVKPRSLMMGASKHVLAPNILVLV